MKRKLPITINYILIILLIIWIILTRLPGYKNNLPGDKNNSLEINNQQDEVINSKSYTVEPGETVSIDLALKDFGEIIKGNNNVVGYLEYDEEFFEKFEINGIDNSKENNKKLSKWDIELNKDKSSSLYGKFCIYTLDDNVSDNQNIANIKIKVNKDVKNESTSIKFTKNESSDGDKLIKKDDLIIEIKIDNNKETDADKDNSANTIVKENNKNTGKGIFFGCKYFNWQIIVILILVVVNIILSRKSDKKSKMMFVIILSLLFEIIAIIVSISVVAHSNEWEEEINKLLVSEKLLNSNEFLVTDKYISRVLPGTSDSEFKKELNKSVTILKEGKEQKNILLATGMEVKTAGETNKYIISVLGDINGDAKCDSVDLTGMIRHLYNSARWNLTNIQKQSADLNFDEKVNKEDALKCIDYIVYGKLDVEKVKEAKKPTISIKGKYDKEEKCYLEDITVVITSNDSSKTMYKIEGTAENQKYTKLIEGEKIVLKKNGVYKISAYSYGKLGNRSEISSEMFVKNAKGKASLEIKDWVYGEEPSKPIAKSTTHEVKEVIYAYSGITTRGEQYGPSNNPPKSAGEYTLVATFPANESYREIVVEKIFSIKSKDLDLENANVELSFDSIEYDGKEQKPGISIVVEGKELEEGKDFEVEYKDNVEPGTATIIVVGKGDYEGELEKTFKIEKAKLIATYEEETITFGEIPKLEVKVEGFVEGQNAENTKGYVAPIIENKNTSAGTYELTPKNGKADNYEFEYVSGTLKIESKGMTKDNSEITLSQDKVEYDGKEQKPGVTIVVDEKELEEGKDFEVEYKDNVDAGTATVVIKGKGDYAGELEETFQIEKVELTATYEGETIIFGEIPKLKVKLEGFIDGQNAENAKDYVAPVINNTNTDVGTYGLAAEGGQAANYKFKYVPGTLTIESRGMTKDNTEITLSQDKVEYDGKEQKPGISIVVDGKELEEGKDFEVEYKDNVDVGTATVIIKGKGNYEGELEKTFEIEKAKLIATYEGETITFGETPKLKVKVEGFKEGQNAENTKGYVAPIIENKNTSAGTYELTPKNGKADNYEFEYVSGTLKIESKGMTKDNTEITLSKDKVEYDGKEQKPGVTIVVDGKELEEGKDFEVEYKDNVDAGTATVVIKGKGDYAGELEETFEIEKVELTATYEGETIIFGEIPKLKVKVEGFIDGQNAENAKDYVAPAINNTNTDVGTYGLAAEGGQAANYKFKYVPGTLTIESRGMTKDNTEITLSQDKVEYDGKEQKPGVTIVVDGKELEEGKDFEVEYKDNVDVGTATVIIKGKGNYEGELEKTFEIEKAKLTATYEGETITYGETPKLAVKVEGFKEGQNAENAKGYVAPIIENKNTSAGEYELTPKGGKADNYEFECVSGKLKIESKGMTKDNTEITLSQDKVEYDGKEQKPEVTIIVDGKELEEGKDFEVEYKDNVDAGTATVVIKGKGNYAGELEETFEIEKVELTATYEGETITYGEEPELIVKVTGFVNNETGITAKNYKKPIINNSNVIPGTYELVAEGGEATNYKFKYVPGTLKIEKLEGTANVEFEPWEYGQKANEPKIESATNDIENITCSYSGTTKSGEKYGITDVAPKDAGEYTITIKLAATDIYEEVVKTVDFEITPKVVQANIAAEDKIYDGTNKAVLTKTLDGLVDTDDVVISTEITFNNKNVGVNKEVKGTFALSGKDASNYELETTEFSSYADITPATLTATYVSEFVGNGKEPELKVKVEGFVNSETASTAEGYIAPTVENSNTDNGSYELTPKGGSADNYEFVYVSGTLTIDVNMNYKVEYYTQQADGTYALEEEEEIEGVKGQNVEAKAKSFEHFELDLTNENTVKSGKIEDENLVLKLYYIPKTYSIEYDLKGGTIEGENPTEYTIYSSDITLINPTKEYYQFEGWTGTDLSSAKENVTIAKGSSGNRKYVANWKENTYSIKFDSNGATSGAMSDMTNVQYSKETTLTENAFIREECNFIEWNTKADGTGESYSDKAIVSKLTDEKDGIVTLYAQWEDVTAPVWKYESYTNSNSEYPEFASSNHTLAIKFTGTDANYELNNLSVDDIEIYVGEEKVSSNTINLSSTNISNGIEYTLTISGISGNGELTIVIPGNTIQDKWGNTNTEKVLSPKIVIDNIAPTRPEILMTANGGLESVDYYYQNSATYTITAGNDNQLENALAVLAVEALNVEDSIAKTTYTIEGAVEKAETTYSSAVIVAPSATRGNCTITAYTYDKAGNKSEGVSTSNNICGSHDKEKNVQVSAETCTTAESRRYHCSYCYVANGTYSGNAALGHNYPCSGANHKRSGGSVTITCSRCTATKKYTVTNSGCTYWSCSCGNGSGGTKSHASGTYTYSSDTYHSYKCSRCGGTVSAQHTHGSWSASGNYHYHKCATCNHTYGSAISHTMSWKKTTTSHSYTCGTCGYTTSAGVHSFTTYTGYKKCGICGYTTGA